MYDKYCIFQVTPHPYIHYDRGGCSEATQATSGSGEEKPSSGTQSPGLGGIREAETITTV